jgi:hypothetical protein
VENRARNLILAAMVIVALAVTFPTIPQNTPAGNPSFPVSPQLNNSKNNSANQTCGFGSYCYTQIALLNSYLFPWYGQTGNAITYMMDRVNLAVLFEFPMLLFYFNRKFKAIETRKVGPDDKNFWLVVPAVVRAALSETESGREVIKKWDELVKKEAIDDIEASILRAKKMPRSSREA